MKVFIENKYGNMKYVNIKNTSIYLYKKIYMKNIKYLKSKQFYEVLLTLKFVKPNIINHWCQLFEIENSDTYFYNVFMYKIKNVYCQNLSEFNYKLFYNILSCGKLVNKWNANVSKACHKCNDDQTAKHLFLIVNWSDIYGMM